MRTKDHYMKLLSGNPNATVGFSLAAQAVYSSRFGVFEKSDDEYRQIASNLKAKYGENLTVNEVISEMQ